MVHHLHATRPLIPLELYLYCKSQRPRRRTIAKIVIALLVLPRLYLWWLSLGLHKTLYDHKPGKCYLIPDIDQGSEDIQISRNGLAFITSGLKFMQSIWSPTNQFISRIYVLDLNIPQPKPELLNIIGDPTPSDFNPHGLYLWENNKDIFIYVVNHLPDNDVVDKYLFNRASNTLYLLKRFEDKQNFHVISDLVLIEEDKFYITNSYYTGSKLELLLQLRWGSLANFDGRGATIVAEGFYVPNGVTISADKRNLYMTVTGSGSLVSFRINGDNSVTQIFEEELGSALDNINIDSETGDLLIGAHPVLAKTLTYLEDPSQLAPSQVLRVKIRDDEVFSVEEIYMDATGSTISGASVAARHNNHLIIGTVSHKTLLCDLSVPDF